MVLACVNATVCVKWLPTLGRRFRARPTVQAALESGAAATASAARSSRSILNFELWQVVRQ